MTSAQLLAGRRRTFWHALAVVALAAGCSSGGATKAGKPHGPVVLRIAARDVDFAGDPAVEDFVRRVQRLSGGTIRIDVRPYWGQGRPGAEQEIVRAVGAGKADLGAVGTRVFDTLGVTAFQALTAPMLIDSYPLERAVIASGLPTRMLGSLEKLRVTGLAVLGEGLRKPVAVERPLLAPADWRGITFAVFRSRGEAAAIRRLGARPSALWGGALTDALIAGTVQGAENDLHNYSGANRQEQAPYVTANVNLWPRTEALLVNADRFARLTAEQRGWLQRAAAAAARRSTTLADEDAALAAQLCAVGARLTNASAPELAALRRAFGPVYAQLERDPGTRAAIATIERLKRATPTAALVVPAACSGRPAAAHTGSRTDRRVLDGTYRFAITDEDLRANGVTGDYVISQNHGIFTWTLAGGRWHVHQQADNPLPASGNGEFGGLYTLDGDRLTVEPPTGPGAPQGGTPITVRWKRTSDGLSFSVVGAADPVLRAWFTAHPWHKLR